MADRMKLIRGAGGGGGKGGGRTPVEEKDSLRSVQHAEVLDLICEGEVEGLVNGLKSVYLDKVPIQNADGSMNFEGVQFAYTHGTQGQAALPGFKSVQNEVAVAVTVLQPTPVVRSITNAATNQVRVTIGIPQLSATNTENGDVGGSSVEFAIDIQANGGGYVEKYRRTISGKTMSKYQLAVVLDLTGSAPWDIRVRRISPPAPGVHVTNAIGWDSYTEIQTLKLRYPNSVVHGLRVSAQQFSRIPERAYDMLLTRVQVPSNYNPITRAYTGPWNGTFTIAWTNNPAWVFYDMVTHPRYGLGEFIDPALVNKWALYSIAQYCDELVPDGRGGMEPRFTCNVFIQEREEAYKVLQDLAAVFRGLAFYSASSIEVAQDAPQTPSMIFANSNVKDGTFNYASGSLTQQHSQVIVYWNNPGDFFKRVPELVTDDDLVERLGIVTLELNAIGVTSRGQAARLGRWALYSEARESETIAFVGGEECAGLQVGQVFQVHDADEAGERLGGRVSVATASAITLDAPVTLNIGETYTLTIMLPDASQPLGYKTEERSVTTAAGVQSTLAVSPPFSEAPTSDAMWLLQSNLIAPTLWRCLGVKEVDQGYEVSGVAHDPGKYALIENGLKLEARPVSRLTTVPVKPTSINFDEVLYAERATYKSRLTVSWLPGPYATGQRYRVNWRYNLGAWNTISDVTDQTVDISGLEPGPVEVRVRAINSLGQESLPLDGSFTVAGKTTPPPPFDVVSVLAQPDGTRQFNFAYTVSEKPVDWLGCEIYYGTDLSATSITGMQRLQDDLTYYTASPVEVNTPIQGTYRFAFRSIDDSFNASTLSFFNITLPKRRTGRTFDEYDEAFESWLGTLGSMVELIDGLGGTFLEALDTSTWDGLTSWDDWLAWNQSPASPCSYTTPVRDLGVQLSGQVDSAVIDADGSYLVELRTSDDNVSFSAWGDASGAFAARFIQLRITLTATAAQPVPALRAWRYIISADLKEEYHNDVNISLLPAPQRIGVGDVRSPVTLAYSFIKEANVIIQDARPGWNAPALIDRDPVLGPRWQFRLNGVLTDPALVDFINRGV